MKTFAFIDVQNTETTALKVLNFIFDWQKLINYLETRWNCEKIFFYPGIQENDEIRKNLFLNLTSNKSEVIVRAKEYRVYKNQDKVSSVICPNCKIDVVHKVDMGYSWKCNCDVEMTLDVLKNSEADTEVLLFTGDGDFAFLIEEIIKRETKVRIFSSALPVENSGYKRLSKKLKKLTNQEGSPVQLIELQNIKKIIQKAV
ncbi:NYN domain-containing protein [Candidatus Nomurabacteria bacterium]|nr:NYN domain-containing protein [Candidatus Nomurabacteria bacterium]